MSAGQCCWPGCELKVPGDRFMCLDHWKQVPGNIMREVNIRLYSWKRRDQAREYLRDNIRLHLAKKESAA